MKRSSPPPFACSSLAAVAAVRFGLVVVAVATVAAGLSVLMMLVEEGAEAGGVVVRAIRLGGSFSSLAHFANHLPRNQQTKPGLLLN
jgi:hypothetical protein